MIEEHGNRYWEVDVLPPAAIERDLDGFIRRWFNEKLWNQREAGIARVRELL